jgi:hypothetical protein
MFLIIEIKAYHQLRILVSIFHVLITSVQIKVEEISSLHLPHFYELHIFL